MTNSMAPGGHVHPDPERSGNPSIGGKRRPAKVVQHPAFRGRVQRASAQSKVVLLPVVSLNGSADRAAGRRVTAVAGPHLLPAPTAA